MTPYLLSLFNKTVKVHLILMIIERQLMPVFHKYVSYGHSLEKYLGTSNEYPQLTFL